MKPGTAYVLVARFAMFGGFFWGGGGGVLGFLAAHSLHLFEIINFFFS